MISQETMLSVCRKNDLHNSSNIVSSPSANGTPNRRRKIVPSSLGINFIPSGYQNFSPDSSHKITHLRKVEVNSFHTMPVPPPPLEDDEDEDEYEEDDDKIKKEEEDYGDDNSSKNSLRSVNCGNQRRRIENVFRVLTSAPLKSRVPNGQVVVKIPKHLFFQIKYDLLKNEGEIDNSPVKGSWSKEEDELLMELVRKKGAKRWSQLSQDVPGRNGKQCRERYLNHLDPKLVKTPFSDREDRIIFDEQKRHGNQWSLISKLLPGRTPNDVKNRWNCELRRRKKRGVNLRKQKVTSIKRPPPPPERRNLMTDFDSMIPQQPPQLHPFNHLVFPPPPPSELEIPRMKDQFEDDLMDECEDEENDDDDDELPTLYQEIQYPPQIDVCGMNIPSLAETEKNDMQISFCLSDLK